MITILSKQGGRRYPQMATVSVPPITVFPSVGSAAPPPSGGSAPIYNIGMFCIGIGLNG